MTDMLILGAPIVALTPGLVEILKACGLPIRFAGLAAVGCAALLAALADIAGFASPGGGLAAGARLAAWVLAGVVYGLAAAGLYSQGQALRAGTRGSDT